MMLWIRISHSDLSRSLMRMPKDFPAADTASASTIPTSNLAIRARAILHLDAFIARRFAALVDMVLEGEAVVLAFNRCKFRLQQCQRHRRVRNFCFCFFFTFCFELKSHSAEH
jgi:hypothetical protein